MLFKMPLLGAWFAVAVRAAGSGDFYGFAQAAPSSGPVRERHTL